MFELIMVLIVFIEGTIQWAKKEYWSIYTVGALVMGLAIAFVFDIDFFAYIMSSAQESLLVYPGVGTFQFYVMKFLSYLFMGVVFARGSNYWNNGNKKLTGNRTS